MTSQNGYEFLIGLGIALVGFLCIYFAVCSNQVLDFEVPNYPSPKGHTVQSPYGTNAALAWIVIAGLVGLFSIAYNATK